MASPASIASKKTKLQQSAVAWIKIHPTNRKCTVMVVIMR